MGAIDTQDVSVTRHQANVKTKNWRASIVRSFDDSKLDRSQHRAIEPRFQLANTTEVSDTKGIDLHLFCALYPNEGDPKVIGILQMAS